MLIRRCCVAVAQPRILLVTLHPDTGVQRRRVNGELDPRRSAFIENDYRKRNLMGEIEEEEAIAWKRNCDIQHQIGELKISHATKFNGLCFQRAGKY